ncbi:MAG: helix-turn-helix domain-containing protein [Desulfobacteraceae bacterium]|nr:helix-turn-helix domain-containing protein [Desulfobacteraceae bacterium]
MTDQSFIDRLLLLIEDHTNGNKKKFAGLIDVSPQNIDSWINKGYSPKKEHLENLRDKLALNINWLLTGKGPMFTEDRDSVEADLVEKGAQVESAKKRRIYSIGGRIAMAREKAGLTLEDLAFELRIDVASLKRIEKGRAVPDAMQMSKMLTPLVCDAEWLLAGLAPLGTAEGEVPPRFPNKKNVVPKAAETVVEYKIGMNTKEEREYIDKLVTIIRTKHDGTVLAIKQNLDAFLTTPDKNNEKKTNQE